MVAVHLNQVVHCVNISFPNTLRMKGLCCNTERVTILLEASSRLSPDRVGSGQGLPFFFGEFDRPGKCSIRAFWEIAVVIKMHVAGKMLHNVLEDWNGRGAVLTQSRGAVEDTESGFVHAGEGDKFTVG